jgi:hypothetical protein
MIKYFNKFIILYLWVALITAKSMAMSPEAINTHLEKLKNIRNSLQKPDDFTFNSNTLRATLTHITNNYESLLLLETTDYLREFSTIITYLINIQADLLLNEQITNRTFLRQLEALLKLLERMQKALQPPFYPPYLFNQNVEVFKLLNLAAGTNTLTTFLTALFVYYQKQYPEGNHGYPWFLKK